MKLKMHRFYRTVVQHFPDGKDRLFIREVIRGESNRKTSARNRTTGTPVVRPVRKRYPWALLWVCVLGAGYLF